MKGLDNKGIKKFLPKVEKPKSVPIAINPAPTRAPVKLCVVDIGIPVKVANKTVALAPKATANRNSGVPIKASGTSPFPLKVLTNSVAKKKAATEPANVVIVAQVR